MKEIFTFLFCFCLIANVYPQQSKEDILNGILQKMKTELNLTDKQIQAVRPIMEVDVYQRQSGIESIQRQASRAMQQRLAQLNEERDAQLKKVLNEQQMEQWKEMLLKGNQQTSNR